MNQEIESPKYPNRRAHRNYTPEFKVQLVAACKQDGASTAALALSHGMNANVLHRWLKPRLSIRDFGAPEQASLARSR